MSSIRHSVALRLALICGSLVIVSVLILSSAFYLGTIVVMARNIDAKIVDIARRFELEAQQHGLLSLARRIEQTLIDGVDSDAEIILLISADQKKLAGNLTDWPSRFEPYDQLQDRVVSRSGMYAESRLLVHRFNDGSMLVVGRDLQDLIAIRLLIERAVAVGAALAILLAVLGTLVFRHQIERRIGTIRRATADIESGNLSRRIQVSGNPDEFDRLSADINRMLDTTQHLMEGVRHISNTIAHNLRTPLGLIRGRLESALNEHVDSGFLHESARFAIDEIDQLIVILEKLLQLAESESGAKRQPFGEVAILPLLTDLTELYDAAAEAQQVHIHLNVVGNPIALGDKDLIATMLANLLDNALRYSGNKSQIQLSAEKQQSNIIISVQDNGPGIPSEEYMKVLQPFYRLDKTQRGTGLGLSIVAAITELHHGQLTLDSANPGLRVTIALPSTGISSAATIRVITDSSTLNTGA